jgi:hypothetical protein
MRSFRDTYGLKTLRPGQVRYIPGRTCDQVRRQLAKFRKARNPDVLRKVFEWSDDTGGIVVRRVM